MKDDAQHNIGKLLSSTMGRDAIHIALAPVVAGERLSPGQHIGLASGHEAIAAGGTHIGIVDPFLPGPVFRGDRFFMFLYPNTITALAHHWTHPAFEAPPVEMPDSPKVAAEKWLREYSEHFDISYPALMAAAKRWLENGEDDDYDNFVVLRFDTPSEAYGEKAKEFWRNYEVMTGHTSKDTERTFFTCSC